MTANKKSNSEFLIVKIVNQNFRNRIVNLEKQFKSVQCRNIRNFGIDVNPLDIEGYHRLSLGKNGVSTTKRVIVKFVNIKHSQAMLQHKNGY